MASVCTSCLSRRAQHGPWRRAVHGFLGRRAFSSIRERAALQEAVLNRLGYKVFDPSVPERSIVDLGIVQRLVVDPGAGKVDMTLQFPTAGHPDQHQVKEAVESALLNEPGFSWLKTVNVQLGASRPQSSSAPLGSGLANVSHVVATSSCKGGVGKSTVAVNLALSLARLGNRVGLLDLDIYGPSLPTLVHAKDSALRPSPRNPKFIVPIEEEGIKMLSFGHVSAKAGVPGAGGKEAAVMRGPMASKVVNQLLLTTEWGELDYLVLDMPPGTGDVQISVGQSVSLSGAVVVTTPQELAVVDVLKGLRMFEVMKVPTLAVVENMAYFLCGKCDEKHRIFGKGAAERILAAFPSIPRSHLFELPLSPAVSAANDSGRPITLTNPDSAEAKVYSSLAAHVCRQIFKERFRTTTVPHLSYDKAKNRLVMRIFDRDSARELVLPPLEVRASDPRTGEAMPSAAAVPQDVRPEKLDFKGKYGVSIVWSDGQHGAIYTYDALERIADRLAAQQQ